MDATSKVCEPERILSANQVARRLSVSRPSITKLIQRCKVVPDYVSSAGSFFNPDRISEISAAITDNRLRRGR
jgi:hypothetical protein